jgi:hypothetical protein
MGAKQGKRLMPLASRERLFGLGRALQHQQSSAVSFDTALFSGLSIELGTTRACRFAMRGPRWHRGSRHRIAATTDRDPIHERDPVSQ